LRRRRLRSDGLLVLVDQRVPAAEQCGWLKDKFGLSWQITPSGLEEMLRSSSRAQVDRVTQALLPMKTLDMETMKRAYEGSG
jgi:predicted 3-demethylubiquinone-9 3-methyltransferase (glyoxalase superfamily)